MLQYNKKCGPERWDNFMIYDLLFATILEAVRQDNYIPSDFYLILGYKWYVNTDISSVA